MRPVCAQCGRRVSQNHTHMNYRVLQGCTLYSTYLGFALTIADLRSAKTIYNTFLICRAKLLYLRSYTGCVHGSG